MKKYLLICALAITGMAFANRNIDLSQVKKNVSVDRPERVSSQGSFNWQDLKSLQDARNIQRAKADDEYAAIDWFDAEGAFHIGVKEGFSFYPTYGMFIVPLVPSVVFHNLYGATDWIVNGSVKEENSATFTMDYLYPGGFYGPSTADHDLTKGGQTYKIKGATYGTKGTFVISALSYHDEWWSEDENIMLTKCAMTCDAGYGTSNGRDLFCVDGGTDPYLDGCGVHLDPADPTKTADTLGVLVENIGVLKIDNIVIPIWNKSEEITSISEYIPDDAEIRLALFPMDENGIYFNDTIASTVITNANFTAGTGGVDYGTLTAKFYEVDIFGELVEVPVTIKGSFYLQLTNFNESGCDFGIYEDLACPVTGTTVYQHDGKFSFRESTKGNGGEYGQNLAISFNGYFPSLRSDTTLNELNAPIEEGYAYFGEDTEDMFIWLCSNVNYEEWEIETEDEWLELQIASDSNWEDYNYLVVAIAVEALPEGEEFREGHLTVIADGAELTFTVKQGKDPQGVETVKVVNDNKLYNVLGMEVGEDYKGIVIRNGEKFIK